MRVSDVAGELVRLGGVATYRQLRQAGASARRIRRARARREIVRAGYGRYVLASTQEHRARAHAMSGVLSHTSAAVHYGWKVKDMPQRAQVLVPRNRNVAAADRQQVQVRFRDLRPAEVRLGVTTPLRTVLDCARDLPFDAALAVADSALRAGDVTVGQLQVAAAALTGPGSARARRVAEHASPMAANPFESVLRAIALEVPGLQPVAQLQVWGSGLWATVDVGDEALRLALEADSWSHHGGRREFHRDCRRYDELVAWGWTVFRFTWEHVMLQQDFVRWCLQSWLAGRSGRTPGPPPRGDARSSRLAG